MSFFFFFFFGGGGGGFRASKGLGLGLSGLRFGGFWAPEGFPVLRTPLQSKREVQGFRG